jgi:hypothetical protein
VPKAAGGDQKSNIPRKEHSKSGREAIAEHGKKWWKFDWPSRRPLIHMHSNGNIANIVPDPFASFATHGCYVLALHVGSDETRDGFRTRAKSTHARRGENMWLMSDREGVVFVIVVIIMVATALLVMS